MAGPREQSVRPPAVAGMFYPAEPKRCVELARSLIGKTPGSIGLTQGRGAMIPHAGWICSGAVAGEAIGTLASLVSGRVDVVVVFGAVHTPIDVEYAALDSHDAWSLPGNDVPVAIELARRLADKARWFVTDERLHRHEHAVEVEIPLIDVVWPHAKVLPIEVPLLDMAVEIGQQTAEAVRSAGMSAIYLASSDMTHYGPGYDLTPAGIGLEGLKWAADNDRDLLQVMSEGSIRRVVPTVRAKRNACGGGAIAAMLAACEVHGASQVRVVRHTNSYQILAPVAPQPPIDAVGYAGVVVGSDNKAVGDEDTAPLQAQPDDASVQQLA